MDNNSKMMELTNGNVNKGLIKLVIPMILANLLNIAYNIVDTIWIGQMVGKRKKRRNAYKHRGRTRSNACNYTSQSQP